MNKKLLSKKVIAIVAAMSLISVPLVAKPIMKKITAYLNPAITYAFEVVIYANSGAVTTPDKGDDEDAFLNFKYVT